MIKKSQTGKTGRFTQGRVCQNVNPVDSLVSQNMARNFVPSWSPGPVKSSYGFLVASPRHPTLNFRVGPPVLGWSTHVSRSFPPANTPAFHLDCKLLRRWQRTSRPLTQQLAEKLAERELHRKPLGPDLLFDHSQRTNNPSQ